MQERERLRREKDAKAAGVASATPTATTPGFINRDELDRQVEEDQQQLQEEIKVRKAAAAGESESYSNPAANECAAAADL
jgi:hypothetical protein